MGISENLYNIDLSDEVLPLELGPSAYYDHIRKINDVFYDQIKMSDQKAAYIFTFMFAFLISSAEGRNVFTWQRYLGDDPLAMILSASLALASIFSIISAILVVLPRKSATSTTLFWGGWLSHRDTFRKAATGGETAYLFQQYIENADALASIACSKYRFVNFAFRGLIVTVLAYVAILVTG
ncbi:DUF5706 domain-containing protein [Sinorhizobium sp. 7-81]|uniref:Pycsar system effector family protein n=1 Tax=Sinorhizobium sp. 8-89 TaxID=3049089 RepID=UPI0024C2E0D7|nr:Pycsar system effector family protein [Sinorhizobium sp. 8-89]MDK1492820.1 DUF5706 domain-containing protein [Sinorhizobium sp. 8-89]